MPTRRDGRKPRGGPYAVQLRRFAAGLFLFALPLPLLLKAILSLWSGDARLLGITGVSFLLMIASALLTRRAVHRDLDTEDRPSKAAGRLPLKSLAALLLALATGFTAFAAVDQSVIVALAYALGAAAGYALLYGVDSRPRSWFRGRRSPASTDAAVMLAQAYDHLAAMEAAARGLENREFRHRVDSIAGAVRKILVAIEQDPADLRRARKFLNVYLAGAQQVTTQYQRAESHASSPDREQNFRTLLVEIENTCHEQHERLLQHDVLDLDVQIEVLSARLRHEGVS